MLIKMPGKRAAIWTDSEYTDDDNSDLWEFDLAAPQHTFHSDHSDGDEISDLGTESIAVGDDVFRWDQTEFEPDKQTDMNRAKKATVENTPATIALVNMSPAKTTPVKNTSVKNIPAKNTFVKNKSVKNTSAKKTLVKNTKAKNKPVKNMTAKNTPAKNTIIKNTSVKNIPAKNTLTKDTPIENTPALNVLTHRFSTLESLPAELLGMIFLQSLNVNLPRASLVLGTKLSAFHLKAELVYKAFASNRRFQPLHLDELKTIYDTEEEIAHLQSDILASKWFNMQFLKLYIPMYLSKLVCSQFKALDLNWLDGTSSEDLTTNLTTNLTTKLIDHACHHLDGYGDGEARYMWESWSLNDWEILRLGLGLREGLLLMEIFITRKSKAYFKRRWKLLNCVRGCRIPEKVLHGPWTDDKCELLTILKRAGASVDWVNSTSGEVAEQGLCDALKEYNCNAVRLLTYGYISDEDKRKANLRKNHPDWSLDQFHNCDETVGVKPQGKQVKAAIVDKNCPMDIVFRLLTSLNPKINIRYHENYMMIADQIRKDPEQAPRLIGYIVNAC